MQQILDKTLDYLSQRVENFKVDSRGKVTVFTCPVCKIEYACNLIPNSNYSAFCCKCNKRIGNIYDFVRILESDKSHLSNEEIIDILSARYGLNLVTITKIEKVFRYYQQNGFDLVPVQANGKRPIEKEWTQKSHKDISEWENWYAQGLNVGVKTGKCSNITVIDIDSFDVPKSLQPLLSNYIGLVQKTTKGYHYFFKYVSELSKGSIDIDNIHIDVENDGGQVVVFPSGIDKVIRDFIELEEIPVMSDELKKFFLQYLKPKVIEETVETLSSNIDDLPNISAVTEGSRNNYLTHLGGVLRKNLNIEDTNYVLNIVNRKFFSPPLSDREVRTIADSLNKYVRFEERDLALKVLNYLKIVHEANSRDIKEITGESKELVDKTLAFLIKEGYIVRGSHRLYHIIRKVEWKDTFDKLDNRVQFQVPYFYDIAEFNYSDLILLGSGNKFGKTTISMNIVKHFVKQNIKPYYISLETGSRFLATARKLGLVEGDFYWAFEADPTKIELEQNAVTIIDWLLVENKAETDTVFKHFIEQLFKTNGFLIVFCQLKADGGYFAPNMITQFPSLAARYFYDKDGDGTAGYWSVDVIREPQIQCKKSQIPCIYDFTTREHKRVEI
jgi:hypothetical protein